MNEGNLAPERLVDPQVHADGTADEIWRWLRAHQPVHYHLAGEYPAFWSVTRYDDAKRIYASPALFSSACGVLLRPVAVGEDPGAGLTLALTDPPRHRALRRMLAPGFSQGCARTLAVQMRHDVRTVLSEAAEAAEFDFAHAVAGRLSSLLIARLIGVPEHDFNQVVRWVEEAFAVARPMTSHTFLTGYVIDLMNERLVEPRRDAISSLADGEVDGELLTETEILLNCENLLGASENAGLSMAAGMAALLAYPDQWQDLAEHDEIMPQAVEEILRFGSSATHSMRTATTDTVVGHRKIAAGERVVVWVRSANYDESQFTAPRRFDLRRQANRHLALGFGEHVCIGQVMARHQLRILLSEMLSSVQSFEQVGEVRPLRSIAVNGPARLPMRINLR